MSTALLLAVGLAGAAPDAETLRASWESRRSALDTHAVYPLKLTENEWQKLAKGNVAKRRERLDGADRVLGMLWFDADLDTSWLAVQDTCGEIIAGFTEELLPGATFQNKLVYQSIKLPWPLQPRQWVILVRNNQPLIGATDNRVWERTWDLDGTRGAKNELPDALWLPVNDGGWYWAEAGGGTLVGYHVRSVIGGAVPDEAATRWSFATLGGMLKKASSRAATMEAHYVEGHHAIQRPDGSEIPRF